MELPVQPKDSWEIIDKDGNRICLTDTTEQRDHLVCAINSHEKLEKHIEALKSVCETYIPTDQIDEANDMVILLCMGNVEEIGRKLISKKAKKK